MSQTRTSCLVLFASCLAMASPVYAFKITEPTEGAMLTAGSTVTVQVDVGKDRGIVTVRYYWYGGQDDALVEQDDATATGSIVAPVASIGLAEHHPPFGGPLLVPKNGIGPMRLLAVAEISRGRLSARSVFDEVMVQVDPKATLATIDFETDKPLQLGRAGQSAYSDPSRPLIPTQVGHPFRRNAATDSEVNPATLSSLLGIGGRHPSESGAG